MPAGLLERIPDHHLLRAAEANVAGPQSEAAIAPDAPTSQAYAVDLPTVVSDEQRRLLVAVLDRIVPPNGTLPGAGTLGADEYQPNKLPGLIRGNLVDATGAPIAGVRVRAERQ